MRKLWIPNSLGKLQNPYEEEELHDLVQRYCEGESELHTCIICSFTRMVAQYATVYAERHPTKADDFLSAGLLALVQAVRAFPNVHTDYNITPYIRRTLKYALTDEIRQPTRGLSISTRTLRRRGTYSVFNEVSGEDLSYKLGSTIELREIFELACKDDTLTRKVFWMEYEGYKRKEIAEHLCIPRGRVTRILDDVHARIREIWNEG